MCLQVPRSTSSTSHPTQTRKRDPYLPRNEPRHLSGVDRVRPTPTPLARLEDIFLLFYLCIYLRIYLFRVHLSSPRRHNIGDYVGNLANRSNKPFKCICDANIMGAIGPGQESPSPTLKSVDLT